ncbi:transcriptional regulator [Moraxella caviae]|uniref:Transcriptional regulator n=1 Tax=Moraxella caviae TaxID=34060 RepID=A0A1T0A9U6_9GAMM|nr:transcriptional regulator [Moraxella caviae]
MTTETASLLFDCLSSPVRLSVFQTLTRVGSEGMVAGELAKRLDIAPNNLSFHLKILSMSQLVCSKQEGRFMRYYANLPLMMALTAFLSEQCCVESMGEDCAPSAKGGCC